MKNIQRCSRCLLPLSLSSIKFDEEGVCSYCRKYESDFKEWNTIEKRKQTEFKELLNKAKSLGRPYDCLVPLSGGKDSTYALYLATRVYKLRTLAVTLDNGYLSEIAKRNIHNALSSCNADHVFYSMNKSNTRQLFKVFVEKTGDFCNACMRSINYSIEFAIKSFNIPLIIKGSGRRVQYVSQIKEVSSLNTPSYFEKVLHGSPVNHKFKYLARNKNKLEIHKIIGGIFDILRIPRKRIMRFVPQHIGLYDYIYKPFPEIIEIIKSEMKWSDDKDTAEHLDCELHDVPFYKDTLRVSNITRNTFYYSGLIRQGLMTREEALEKEEKELKNSKIPDDLRKYLKENEIKYEDYKNFVINADKSKYEPKFQKVARNIYHKLRKF